MTTTTTPEHDTTPGLFGTELGKLGQLVAERRRLEAAIDEQVAACRWNGRSWAEIAAELGMTRQAAHKRWAHVDEDNTRKLRAEIRAERTAAAECYLGPVEVDEELPAETVAAVVAPVPARGPHVVGGQGEHEWWCGSCGYGMPGMDEERSRSEVFAHVIDGNLSHQHNIRCTAEVCVP